MRNEKKNRETRCKTKKGGDKTQDEKNGETRCKIKKMGRRDAR